MSTDRRRHWIIPGVLLLLLVGCASASEAQRASGALPASEAQADSGDSPIAPGLGTLRQDDFTVSMRSGALLIKVTPLSESVIRLAAPDTYERLRALAESRRTDVTGSFGTVPELFLVSFFSYDPDVEFQPQDVELAHQGRVIRAARILPITPGWGAQRLRQQETQSAIYAFEADVDYDQSIGIRYRALENRGWDQIIGRLQAERARVHGRGP